MITSKPTWKLKHTNSILEYSEYFFQISSKSLVAVLSYTILKFRRFFETHCATTVILHHSRFCLGQPEWAHTRRNIHPLTPVMVINHPYLLPPSTMIHGILLVQFAQIWQIFPQSLSKFSLVYFLAWHPPLHTPYISLTNYCLLFAAHAHTITTCFQVCSSTEVMSYNPSLSQPFTWNSFSLLNATHPSDHSHFWSVSYFAKQTKTVRSTKKILKITGYLFVVKTKVIVSKMWHINS